MTIVTRGDVPPFRLLAISGSLRARSSNTSLLRLAMDVAPDDVRIVMYEGLASAVRKLGARSRLEAVLIALRRGDIGI